MDDVRIAARLAALEAEIASLRSLLSARTDEEGADAEAAQEAAPSAIGTTSRRALIGGAVAAAAAVTGVLATGQPAAAGTGTMQYGTSNNAAGSETTLISSSTTATLVVSNGSGAGLASTTSSGEAIRGSSTSGTGVHALSSEGDALRAEAAGHGYGAWISSVEEVALLVTSPRGHLLLAPGSRVAPTNDHIFHDLGELIFDRDGSLWACTVAGTPGTWTKLGGSNAAGAFHLLRAPVRIYDSRPGTAPAVGVKKPLAAGSTRVLDATANLSGIPTGATGALLTCMVINAASGGGNFTVWADGVSKPSANSMVWGGDDGRHSTLATSALSAARKIQVSSSLQTDVVVDVVGYYR